MHPTPQGPRLQRVPPNDTQLEAHLLGAALLDPAAATTVANLPPDTWYHPRHRNIARLVTELHQAGQPTDPGTVAARARQDGTYDTIGGYQALGDLVADTPTTRSADTWADTLRRYHAQRTQLDAIPALVDAIYAGIPTIGLTAQLHAAAQATDTLTFNSWEPANLAATLAGEGPDTTPTVLHRTDGHPLLYPARVHAINAEPEAGKSWVALTAATQELHAGNHVLYIDLESDPTDIVNRLLTLQVRPDTILDRFHYIRPTDPLDQAAAARAAAAVATWQPTLAVVDGVTEAMHAAGLKITDNDDIAAFYALLPRPLARLGPAVLLIDHVVKEKESQGRWGIGGQHKLAGVDGAAYKLETVTPFAPGKAGTSRLVVAKDRHGQIRAHSTTGPTQIAAVIRYHPADNGAITITVDPAEETERKWEGHTHCQNAILELLASRVGEEMSVNQLATDLRARNLSFRNGVVSISAEELVGKGRLARREGPRNSRLYSYQNASGAANWTAPHD